MKIIANQITYCGRPIRTTNLVFQPSREAEERSLQRLFDVLDRELRERFDNAQEENLSDFIREIAERIERR